VIRQFANLEELSEAVAGEFCEIASQAVAARGRCTVVLAGGSTPQRLYRLLASEPFRRRVRWDSIEFFWSDERAVPPDHEDSNFGMASSLLLEPLEVLAAHIHRIHAERDNLKAAASAYEEEIARVFDVPAGGPPPAFDLVLLGMGADGHTASLFPGAETLGETSRWVVSYHTGTGAADRVTMTPRILNAAHNVIVMVAGPEKAETLALVLEGVSDPRRWPAQTIQPTSGVLLWFVDRAAAARLGPSTRRNIA
jgi:6-phosphogluconolactonase